MSNINWFPGHMTKTIRILKDMVKVIDVIIEIIDARIPTSSSNPVINELSKNKQKIIIMNKIDLADDQITKCWKQYFLKNNIQVILLNSKRDRIKDKIVKAINFALSEKIERYSKKGLVNYQIKVAILGIPNVGKSTIINTLIKGKRVKTGNKPGLTRGNQWVEMTKNIHLLDTPGILWPKFDNEIISKNLAITGSIKPDILNKEELVEYGIEYLISNYWDLFSKEYFSGDQNIEKTKKPYEYIEILEKKYKISNDKIINKLFYDFINNKLGKISWEFPSEK